MNPILIDPTTDAQLRSLDPTTALSDTDRADADLRLAAILATDPASAHELAPGAGAGAAAGADIVPIRRRRQHVTRWAAVAAALATASAGAVALSTAGAPAAYATWTATPAQVAASDAAVMVSACRDKAGSNEWYDPATLDVRLTERRGDFVAVLLTGAGTGMAAGGDVSLSCVGRLAPGDTSVSDLSAGASGGGGFAPPPAGGFYEGAMSQFTMGANWLGQGGEPASFVDGRIGSGVARLTIHAFGQSVEASITNGTYAAWWPGRTFADKPLPPSGEGGPEPELTYDLVLTDGTVLTDVAPTRPTQ